MKTKVRKLFHRGLSSTVEWYDSIGNVKRSVLPSEELIYENGDIFVENVEEGQPYGVDWDSLISFHIGDIKISDMLHKNGIWTLEDYAKNSAVVNSVFKQAFSAVLQQFKEAVLQYGKGN